MTGKNAMPQGSATAQTSAQNALDDLNWTPDFGPAA